MNFRPGTYHFSSSSEYILPLEYQDSQHMSAHRLVFLYAPFINCLTFKWKSLGRATVACSCLKASFIPCHRYASEEGWANSREAKQPHCAYMCFVRVPTDWHFNEREGQQKKRSRFSISLKCLQCLNRNPVPFWGLQESQRVLLVSTATLICREQAAGSQNREAGLRPFFTNLAVSDKDYGIYCKVFHPNDLPWCFFQFTFILGSHGAYRKKRKEDEGGKEKVKER